MKKRSHDDSISFVTRVRLHWLNHEIRTAILLEARLEGNDWNCPCEITLNLLRELEMRLVEISTIKPSKTRDLRPRLLSKLIEERDFVLTSLRNAGIAPANKERAQAYFSERTTHDVLSSDARSDTGSGVSSFTNASLVRRSDEEIAAVMFNYVKIANAQQIAEMERLRKELEELKVTLAIKDQNERATLDRVRVVEAREQVFLRQVENGQHSPDAKHRYNLRMKAELEDQRDTVFLSKQQLEDMIRNENILTNDLIPHPNREDDKLLIFMGKMISGVCHARQELSPKNREHIVIMREEYLARFRSS